MGYLDRLKIQNATSREPTKPTELQDNLQKCPDAIPTKPTKTFDSGFDGFVGTVTGDYQKNSDAELSPLTPAIKDAIEEAKAERAAVMEVDGHLSRAHARYLSDLAEKYYTHHWSCPVCRIGTVAGAGVHRPCPEGAELWQRYSEAAGRECTA